MNKVVCVETVEKYGIEEEKVYDIYDVLDSKYFLVYGSLGWCYAEMWLFEPVKGLIRASQISN